MRLGRLPRLQRLLKKRILTYTWREIGDQGARDHIIAHLSALAFMTRAERFQTAGGTHLAQEARSWFQVLLLRQRRILVSLLDGAHPEQQTRGTSLLSSYGSVEEQIDFYGTALHVERNSPEFRTASRVFRRLVEDEIRSLARIRATGNRDEESSCWAAAQLANIRRVVSVQQEFYRTSKNVHQFFSEILSILDLP